MISVKIDGLERMQASLAGAGKQVRFATAQALTRTAMAIRDEQQRVMPSELNKPRPQTVKAMRYTRATRDNLTASVEFTGRGMGGAPAAEYLAHNIAGGRRGMKRSEQMLMASGILPSGYSTIPGVAAKIDSYGNMSRGQIVSILSYFKIFGIARFAENTRSRQGSRGGKKGDLLNTGRMNRVEKTRSAHQYFLVPLGQRTPAGIWERTKTQAKPILMFVAPGTYRKIVEFPRTADRIARRDFGRLFDQSFQEAMRTAR